MSQDNLAESFLKIVVYLTFPYLISYKILHVYLRVPYPSHHVRQEIPLVVHIDLTNTGSRMHKGSLFIY